MRSERADGCAVSGPVRGGSEARSAGAAARVARHALPAWCLLVAAAVASGGMPATGAPPLVLTDQAAVVSESPATASVRPRIAVTADGAVHVVWQEDTTDASIVMHRYRSPGGTWSTPVEVFWGAAQPAIATDGSTVVVAFVRMPFDRTDHTEVLWNSWDARARSWQDEAIAIEGDLGLDGSQPAAAIDGPGGFLWLVWASSRRAENVPYYARIRLATGEVDTADVIQRYEEGAQGPVVSIDGEGVVYAAWSATYPSGEAEIVLWRYATGVGYWTPVDTAGYDQLRQARSPSVAVGAGVVCLAWHEGTVDQPNEVVLSCDRAGGSVWLGNASHSPAVRSLAPSIAFDDRRGPLLAWRERSSPPPEHLLFTQGLPPATEPARVTDGSASPVDSPALTFHGSHVYAAWVEATSEGASDVRFARWPVELPTATPTATRQPVRTATSTPTPTATGSPSVTPTGTPPTATPSPTGTRHIGWVFLPFATMP